MRAEFIDRRRVKAQMRETAAAAQVSAKGMTALYLGIYTFLNLISVFSTGRGMISTFSGILINLISVVLGAGFMMYAMAIIRGERAEYLCLFDGFSIAGKVILLYLVKNLFVILWSMLFVIPGIIASYRYRFAELNLYENPDLGIFEAINLSKRQTAGYKQQLFLLDFSFFGWNVLAIAPLLVENTLLSLQMSAAQVGMDLSFGLLNFTSTTTGYALWVLGCSLWQLAVSLFYLVQHNGCVVHYYEIAKETSRLDPNAPATPDGL